MAKGKKFYTVWEGHEPGVYDSWTECQRQIKGFPGAKYKSFKSQQEAEDAFLEPYSNHISKSGLKKSKTQLIPISSNDQIVKFSISVDAACSGNPGIMEYQGVWTEDGSPIFHQGPFKGGTNNIGEFLALVHALAWLQKHKMSSIPIYTDSRTALAWIRNKAVKTSLKKTKENQILFELIDRAIYWLKNNKYDTTILKWDTKNWGEIPADFGRK